MKRMRHLKLLAAVTLVLVALSGFSPARSSGGHGGSSKSRSSGGHGGGGCSSKKSSSHSSSDYDNDYDNDYDDDYGSSGGYTSGSTSRNTSSSTSGGSTRGQARGSGTIAECVAAKGRNLEVKKEPGATVRVRNSGTRKGTFTVNVNFRDVNGEIVDTGSAVAVVRAGSSKTVEVAMEHPEDMRKVEQCEVSSVR
ncbi:hypothetical protein [Streptomyces spirodelae]|uniref:Secreted protein n=1 Tax=Streptomyces spirodelae TaxID=2812904 RepID=A0ABS3WTU6_9ACTN|nr:hypothetical protein [Streptomyces spirodelae]MBO8186552.1 hypothetical protein [Streptomyces spirodelae]